MSIEIKPTLLSSEDPKRKPLGEERAFGRSLHVDLYGVSREICDDLGFCYAVLDDLTAFLGMHKQSPPFIFRSPEGEFPERAGLSGWVPLIESGISIHTLTVTGFVSLDIYTCGCLSIEDAIRFVMDRFKADRYEQHYLVRGITYHA
jgi:S-adenosylmethionine/arginine decarboxylase-like enzyme